MGQMKEVSRFVFVTISHYEAALCCFFTLDNKMFTISIVNFLFRMKRCIIFRFYSFFLFGFCEYLR